MWLTKLSRATVWLLPPTVARLFFGLAPDRPVIQAAHWAGSSSTAAFHGALPSDALG